MVDKLPPKSVSLQKKMTAGSQRPMIQNRQRGNSVSGSGQARQTIQQESGPTKMRTSSQQRLQVHQPPKMYGKPSDKLTQIKTSDPFANQKTKHKTNFGHAYASGAIPCRINHGCSKLQLQWDTPPDVFDSYDPVLVNCFEGLCETQHPLQFIASQALLEMMQAKGAQPKTVVLLPKLMMPLRMALLSKDLKVNQNAIEAVRVLAECCGESLNAHLGIFVAQLNSKIQVKSLKEQVTVTCRTIEDCCGQEASKMLKTKVPTYASFF